MFGMTINIKISCKQNFLSKVSNFKSIDRPQLGPRLLIKFLQDAAGKGDLDPWDIDVINVIDSFLEQYTIHFPKSPKNRNTYQKN